MGIFNNMFKKDMAIRPTVIGLPDDPDFKIKEPEDFINLNENEVLPSLVGDVILQDNKKWKKNK